MGAGLISEPHTLEQEISIAHSMRYWRSIVAVIVLISGPASFPALCQITDASKLPPATSEAFQAAISEQKKPDLVAAERDYRIVIAQSPDFLPARFNLGLVLDNEGHAKEALEQFLFVDKELSTFPGTQFFTGIEEFRLGKYEAAVESLRLATEQSSNDSHYWFWLARSELALNHEAEGKAALDQALHISPHDPSTLYLRALLYISDQDFTHSELVLTQLVEAYPQVPEFYQALGSVYYLQGRLDKAQQEYKEQLAIDPHNPQAQSMLGVILLDRGQAAAAIPYLQQGLDANSSISFLQLKMGQALSATNQSQYAIEHLQKATELDPEDGTAHYLLWKIYVGLHRTQDAEQELAAFKRIQSAGRHGLGNQPNLGSMLPGMNAHP